MRQKGNKNSRGFFSKKVTPFLLRHSGWVVLTCILLSIPSFHYTTRLYGNLKPDLEELLPKTARSILDLSEIRSRLQSIDNLAVLVFSKDTQASKRFVQDLVGSLEKEPAETISSVEYKIDRELEFFGKRKALFVELLDLEKIRDYLDDRITFEKELYNPLNIFSGKELAPPQLDLNLLLKKYTGQADSFSRFPEGYYATPDELKRVVLVYLPARSSGIAGVYHLKEVVAQTIAQLDPKKYAPDLEIQYTGGVQNTIEEHTALIADIEKSAEVVFVFVTLSLVVFFRSIWATAALFLSLFMARFWTFAATWFAVGYLNANSAFMGSIVLGSGITFGVMLLSRYLEERRNRRIPLRAALISMRSTVRATLTASVCAGLAYGSLFLTQFEGFRQYGIIGFMGMLFCWVSSVVVFPCLLILLEKWRPLVKATSEVRATPATPEDLSQKFWSKRHWVFGPLTYILGRYPGTILLVSIGLTLLSIFELVRMDPSNLIETNLGNLRNKISMTQGSGFLSHHVDEIFQRYLSPVVLLEKTPEKAEELALRIKKKKSDEGDQSLIAAVRTLSDFVPLNQTKKIDVLNAIDGLVTPRVRQALSSEDRSRIDSFLTPESFVGLKQSEVPPLVLQKFTEKDGSVGKLVLVEPPLSSSSWSGEELNRFVNDLRDLGGPDVPVAGSQAVTSDMLEAISRDGPRATWFAFVSVVIVVFLFFRVPRIAALMLSALVLGNLWLFGYVLLVGLKINFLNFIALPITFGIGVDYGVNVFHRYMQDPEEDILKVVRETGAAVGLCSLTTMIGYSSLLIAGNQAFVSFGHLAVMGELTSVLTALFAVPAFLIWHKRRRVKLLNS
jgi:predicted RND superfamily exporter protein